MKFTYNFPNYNLQDYPVFETDWQKPKNYTGICFLTFVKALCWFVDGKSHREHEPATIWFDKYSQKPQACEWRYNNKIHRLDGPSYWSENDVDEHYVIHGVSYTKEDYYKHPLVIKNLMNKILSESK